MFLTRRDVDPTPGRERITPAALCSTGDDEGVFYPLPGPVEQTQGSICEAPFVL
jgi:hypothetical protein